MFSAATLWFVLTTVFKLRLVRWSVFLGAVLLSLKVGLVPELVCNANDPVFQHQSLLSAPSYID